MKASLIKTMALATGFVSLTALSVVSAMAGAEDSTQSVQAGKTRAEVRAEYFQAVREGTLANTSEMDEGTYRTLTTAKGLAMKGGKALAQATESGTNPDGSSLSATAPSTSSLTREAVRADTLEWLRLHRGDIQMGGD